MQKKNYERVVRVAPKRPADPATRTKDSLSGFFLLAMLSLHFTIFSLLFLFFFLHRQPYFLDNHISILNFLK